MGQVKKERIFQITGMGVLPCLEPNGFLVPYKQCQRMKRTQSTDSSQASTFLHPTTDY